MSDLYAEGGWHLVPAQEVELPRVTLTKQQLKENAAAEKAHDKLCGQIQALAKKVEGLGGTFYGDYDDGGEGIGLPPFELPHDPEAYDTLKFGPKEWAYYEWLGAKDKPALLKLKSFGIGAKYVGSMLMSVGRYDDIPPRPPEVPDWAK